MEFHWEDGSTTPIEMFQKINGPKKNGRRPLAIGISLEDEAAIKSAGDEGLKWFNKCVVGAVQRRRGND